MNKFDLSKQNSENFYDVMSRFFSNNNLMANGMKTMQIDVQETDDAYIVEADMPGVDKEHVKIEMDNHLLQIHVEQKSENEQTDEDKKYVWKERSFVEMHRALRLPKAKEEDIKAKLDNGVLKITVPKEIPVETKSIIEIE